MRKKKETTVDDLVFDSANVRTHGDKNKKAIRNSVKQFKAGRSILVDADNVIRAGNGTAEAWQETGGKVRIIETDGSELIAVKRTDLKGAEAMAYAIADNRASELAEWDSEILAEQLKELDGDFDIESFGFDSNEMELLTGFEVSSTDMPSLPEGEKDCFQQMSFVLHDEQVDIVKEAIEKSKLTVEDRSLNRNQNGNALTRIAEAYCE